MLQQDYHKVSFKQILLKLFIISTGLILFVYIYRSFNPLAYDFFPKCPLKYTTGLECPGCGSQRAIHQLLNFNLIAAFKYNPLLVLSIPYIIVEIIFRFVDKQLIYKQRKVLYGPLAIKIILCIVIAYWIGRNIILHLL
ncbi:DUF2752 domain-containing protein [Flammeovirga yaeyamensis]|uniref:DUF2752 domain-containing protein n=1 Tax=Flammeovirga yaeyamensis TaxID=367791 RepID=UPI0034DACAB0